MKTITKMIGAACLAGALAATSVVPAQAQSFSFGFGFGNGPSFHSYNDSDWRWRNRHFPRARSNFGFSVNVAPRYRSSHVSRCEDRFRSYDRRTDMYMGFDGDWHRCTL